ncbi:MAG: hypothetical protein CSA61_00560 [Neptuniibacter caesariensis]|uniref:CzcB-like barrel-sandwich hybrid domain-containing protein n=1 Tax=Neptuniibacter caesariensis TaxID=207954 RepID=A0A2G6JBG0_NEPCE|nr:MAG: hypothetical protein CSA61_00560 [Neptuniibacter caesariensis]
MKYILSLLCLLCSCSVLSGNKVVVAPLSELLVITKNSAPADVVNEHHAPLSFQVGGVVERIAVTVGDELKKGQVLATLECRDYELAQMQAQSSLKALRAQALLARQQLSRAEQLLQRKNASRDLRDQRRAELDSLIARQQGAEVRVQEAELAVERCALKAPFSGVVTDLMLSPGALAAPGSVLVKVLQTGAQEVNAELSAMQLQSVKSGSRVYYEYAGVRYPVALRTVLPLIDSRARTQSVRFSFVDKPALTGSSGRVFWQAPAGRLPVKYIISRQGQLGVMQFIDGKAKFVALPSAVEGQAAVVSDASVLNGSSNIIIEGQHAVAGGDDVEAVNLN